MSKPTNQSGVTATEQYIQNSSFDADFGTQTFEPLGYDGVSLQRMIANSMALKVTVSGDITYIGIAAPGTAQGTAKWQCKKIDTSSGVVITWADGDASFDNTSTDLTALSYS